MDKIVIISCTNRTNSNTLKVSRIYEQILKSKNINTSFLDFCSLPHNLAFSELFNQRSNEYAKIINDFISEKNKFIFILPEYNGSFPGILKVFIDSIPPKEWINKKACLVGVSLGKAGNIRGLDHLTDILNYLKIHVYHTKIPISQVDLMLDAKADKFISDLQEKTCINQLDGFLNF